MKIKIDFEGNPIPPQPKCIHCGKKEGEHRAKTKECPKGIKHRVVGHTWFGPETFLAKARK